MKPTDVFVPGRYPIESNNAYAVRTQKQDDFSNGLRRFFVPIVYGGYGVGKSSMALKSVADNFPDHRIVYIESVSGVDAESLKRRILKKLKSPTKIEKIVADTSLLEAEVEVGAKAKFSFLKMISLWFQGKARANRKREASETKHFEYSPLEDIEVIEQCDSRDTVLILDELHKATDDFFTWLSQFIKKYSNFQAKKLKIALLGTSSDPTKLISRDFGIDRTISEVKLESFSPEESRDLIESGFAKLHITIEKIEVDRITKLSVGSPFIIQFICLSVAEQCKASKVESVQSPMLNKAMQEYSNTKAQRMIHIYKTACETLGDIRYRKQILDAMALIEDEYVTMEQLVDGITKSLGTDIKSTALSGPLRELKTEKYGSILRDIDYPGLGRVHNYSAFSDPAMKFIIRWIAQGNA